MRILIPKKFLDTSPGTVTRESPLFFLAGPVRGGGGWQVAMARLLKQQAPACIIAVPCRWKEDHTLRNYFAGSDTELFERQLNWERHYLAEAGIGKVPGCIVFWLPSEDKGDRHPGPEPYAMDTRGELAEWRMRMKFQSARVVVGADSAFYGLSQIERNFSLELGYKFPIYETMEEVAKAAAKRALA